jgi:2-polyprenyl-3-methyl-5-hydroxy-6-metoxy-1,4-benzoquinol methylase
MHEDLDFLNSNMALEQHAAQSLSRKLNQEWFDQQAPADFVSASPHLKHRQLTERCLALAVDSFHRVAIGGKAPSVLDLGAGEGMLTCPYLDMGARVTAVDASPHLLEMLQKKAAKHSDRLTPIVGDVFDCLEGFAKQSKQFDIISACSFLHHIPDYLRLCQLSIGLLERPGIFFTFQDPLRYDTLPSKTRLMDRASYFGWRCFRGNYVRGIKTRLRRLRGVYREDIAEDVTEFHVVRNGVDQEAIQQLFERHGFKCEVHPYWSTQSGLFQAMGEKLNLHNTFAVVATSLPK